MATQICVFNQVTGLIDITPGVSSYTGAGGEGSPVVLNVNGEIDSSFTGAPVSAIAATDLPSGSLVNLYYTTIDSISGVYAQLASASSLSNLPALGFVTAPAEAGDFIVVCTQGLTTMEFVSGFSPSDIGSPVYLSPTTAGSVTKVKPTSPNFVQTLGFISQVVGSLDGYLTFPFTPSFYTAGGEASSFSDLSGTCAVDQGGTSSNLAGTGGPHQVLKQSTVGGAITVGQLASTDLSDIGSLVTESNLSAAIAAKLVVEPPSGSSPGTVFTLTYSPTLMIGLYLNGVFQIPVIGGVGVGEIGYYTLSTNTVTMEVSTGDDDIVFAVYLR